MSLTYSPKIVTDGLLMCLDPSQNKSYPTLSLPVKDSLVLWLDAADDTTFSYSSGTVVSQWRDKSPFNNHVSQSTVANQPTRNSFLNSRRVITFDGSNDSLSTTNSLDLSTTHTIFAIASQTVGSSDAGLVSINNTLNNGMTLHNASSYLAYFGDGSKYVGYGIGASTYYIFTKVFKGSSSTTRQIYLNGTSATTSGTITASDTTGVIRLGQQSTYLNGTIAEVIIFNRELSDIELKQVHTYLGLKWGILNTDRSAIDLSGNQKNGFLGNGTTTYMPKFDYDNKGTFFFDDSDDTLLTNIPITSTPALSNFTYEIWTKLTNFPTVAPANGYGVTYRAGFLMGASYYGGAGLLWYGDATATACTLYGFIRGTDGYRSTSGYSLSLNQYYHLVLVNNYGANKLQLFVNGVLYHETSTATAEYDAGNAAAAGNIGIAKAQIDGGGTANYSYYAGRVGLARIYSRALSANEILQNYEAQKKRFADTLIVQGLVLNLDANNPYSYSGAGTTWYDISGAGYNATIVNAPTFNSDGLKFFTCSSTQNFTISNPISTQPKLSQIWTVSAWINIDTVTSAGARYLMSGLNNGICAEFYDSGTLLYLNGGADDYYTYGGSIEGSGWVMLTFLFRNSDGYRKIYSNLTDITTSGPNNTSTPTGNSATFTIADNMRGKIAQIMMYNRLLTFAEIVQNYNATKGRFGL